MKAGSPSHTARALIWFLACLTLFLTAGVGLSVFRQRAQLLAAINAHVEHEMDLLEIILSNDLRKHDYIAVNRYLTLFGHEHKDDIAEIKVVAPNGFVLAEHTETAPTEDTHIHTRRIAFDAADYITLEVIEDVAPTRRDLAIMTTQYLGAAILFTAFMGGFLWYVLRKTAFIPLEQALEKVQDMNETLEQSVAERTSELMRTNDELEQEISERKRAERALSKSEKFLQTIIDTEPEGVNLVAADGALIMMNRAGLSMIQADSFDQVRGSPIYPLIVPEYREAMKKITNEVFQGKTGSLTFEILSMRGRRRWLDTHVVPLRNDRDEIVALLGITRDVTEQKRAEGALRESEQRYRMLFHHSPIGIFNYDTRLIVTDCNDNFIDLMQSRRELLLGLDLNLLKDQRIVPALRAALDGQKGAYEGFYSATTGPAVLRMALRAAPLTDQNGAITGGVAIVEDIFERKMAEETLVERSRHALLGADIGIALTKSDDLLQALQACTEAIVHHLDAFFARIWTKNDDETALILQASAGAYTHRDGKHSLLSADRHQNKIGFIFQEGKPHLTNMVIDDPLISDQEWARREGIVAFAGHPLIVEGKVVGVMGMFAKKELTKATLLALSSVADEIALGIVRKQAGDSLLEEKNKLKALIDVSRGITSTADVRDLYRRITAISREIMKFDFSTLMTLSDDKASLIMQDTIGFPDSTTGSFTLVEGQGLCTYVVKNKRAETVPDFSKETRFEVPLFVWRNNIQSALCVPMVVENEMIGLLIGHSLDKRDFSDDEVFLYQSIANQAAVAIEHSKNLQVLKRSEEDLKLFRVLIDQSNDPIFVIDPETGGIMDCNDKACESLGYTRQELLTIYMSNINPSIPDILAWTDTATKIVLRGSLVMESSHRQKDGGIFPVEINIKHIVQKGTQYLVALARDITERKRMEREREDLIRELQTLVETVSRAHQEWRNTFDSIQDPIYILDAQHRIIRANRAFAEFVGLNFKEIIGRQCFELLHGTNGPHANCPFPSMNDTGNPAAIEFVEPRRQKTLVMSHFPYYSVDGKFCGSISIARDVTQERENEVKIITNERLASLGQMAAGIAHEINNPLTAIMGCAEALHQRVTKGRYDPPLFDNYLKIIQEEVLRCKDITTNMLSVSRKASSETGRIDIRHTLEKTIELIGYQGRLKDVRVVKNFVAEMPPLQGNEGELRQVFLSITTNALDAMGDKGTLTVRTGFLDDTMFVEISDTGPGISAEHLSRIFDPFFTTKTDKGGTGLGLSIAQKIISNHQGNISVASAEGKGTTFTITLPVR